MNNKGFIATSLIYSFFLIFITLFLTIIADYLQNKVLLSTIEDGIKDNINSTKGIEDFDVGDVLFFSIDATTLNSNLVQNSSWVISSINHNSKSIVLYSMDIEKGADNCVEPDCVNLSQLEKDLTDSSTNNFTKQLEILNTFNFNHPTNEEIFYEFYLNDKDGNQHRISKNCIKIEPNTLNYNECPTTSTNEAKYRIRITIQASNVKFAVTPSGSANFTITEVL